MAAAKQSREFLAAKRRAHDALERRGLDPAGFVDAVRLFAAAVEDAAAARLVWVEQGRPIVAMGGATGQAEVPSPLFRAVQDAEKLVAVYAEPLGLVPDSGRSRGVSVGGRPAGSASAPDRVAPAKFTMVKGGRS